jgi:hypothetical protein
MGVVKMKKSLPVIGCALLLLGIWLAFYANISANNDIVEPANQVKPVKPVTDIDIGRIHIHPRDPSTDIPTPPVPDCDDAGAKPTYKSQYMNPVAPKADPDDSADEQPCVNGNCPKKTVDVNVKTDNVAVDVKSEQPTQKYQTYKVRKRLFR